MEQVKDTVEEVLEVIEKYAQRFSDSNTSYNPISWMKNPTREQIDDAYDNEDFVLKKYSAHVVREISALPSDRLPELTSRLAIRLQRLQEDTFNLAVTPGKPEEFKDVHKTMEMMKYKGRVYSSFIGVISRIMGLRINSEDKNISDLPYHKVTGSHSAIGDMIPKHL